LLDPFRAQFLLLARRYVGRRNERRGGEAKAEGGRPVRKVEAAVPAGEQLGGQTAIAASGEWRALVQLNADATSRRCL
jgi:hypothetical protein